MRVQALRGVCVGVERHLRPGDIDDIDPNTANYLAALGAVTFNVVEPAAAEPEPTRAGKPGKKED